jgi:hypothetical protein
MATTSVTSWALHQRARRARELSDQALKPITRTKLLRIAARLDALARGDQRRVAKRSSVTSAGDEPR